MREYAEPEISESAPQSSDRKKLGTLDREFRTLSTRLDATRLSVIRTLPELSDPTTGKKISKDTRNNLEGIYDPDAFFHELSRYADLRGALDGDFGALTRYRALKKEIIETQMRVSAQVEEQSVEEQISENIPASNKKEGDVVFVIAPEPPPLTGIPKTPPKINITAPRTDADLSRLNFIPRSTGDLLRNLRQVKNRLLPKLPELLGKNHEKMSELSRMTHPVEFLQALEAEGVNIKDLMHRDHYACLAEYERRMIVKSVEAEERRKGNAARRAEREARRTEEGIVKTAPDEHMPTEEAVEIFDVTRLKNDRIAQYLRFMRKDLTPRLNSLVGEKAVDVEKIKYGADFLRALAEAGVDLERELGERRASIFGEHERRLKLREERKKSAKEKSGKSAYGSMDEQIDRITIDVQTEEKELVQKGEIETPSLREMTEYQRFRAFYARAREVKIFAPKEEYDIFASYADKKREILEQMLSESEVMKRTAVLFIPLRHLDPGVQGVRKSTFGYQFFQGYSLKETSDIFGVLDGDELIQRLLALADKEDSEDGSEEIEFADDEESDDDFIDFNLSKPEICRLVRQEAKSYFQHFERMEKILKRRSGKNFASLKKEIPENKNEAPVGTAMRVFQADPSTPSLVRAIESLWLNSRASENPSESVFHYLEDFFAELRALGIRFSVKHLPKTVSSALEGMEATKKEIVPLIMRLGPSPALVRTLSGFSMQEEIAPSVQALLNTHQRILTPYIRNVCFGTLFYIRRGEKPDECVQCGTLGLLRAVDTFDHRSGVRFYEYCWPSITEAIARGLYTNQNKIHIPVHHKGDIAKVRKAMQFAETVFGDQSDEHIAKAMKQCMKVKKPLSVEEVSAVCELIRLNEMVSMETPQHEGWSPIRDKLAVADTETAEEIVTGVIKKTSHRSMESFMEEAGLTSMERAGVGRFLAEQTLQHIADTNTHDTFGYEQRYSRERIRQVGEVGLKKLRRYLKRKRLGRDDIF